MREPTKEGDTNATCGVGATLGGPPGTPFENPGVGNGLGHGSQPQVWARNTLVKVMDVLCRLEGGRAWVWNVSVCLIRSGLSFKGYLMMAVRSTTG